MRGRVCKSIYVFRLDDSLYQSVSWQLNAYVVIISVIIQYIRQCRLKGLSECVFDQVTAGDVTIGAADGADDDDDNAATDDDDDDDDEIGGKWSEKCKQI